MVIDSDSPQQRVDLAVERLTSGVGVVLLNDTVALRRSGTGLRCEVLDSASSSRRCEHEFEVMVENAQRMLERSALGQCLPHVPCEWCVVADDGSSTLTLWRAP